MTALSPSRRRLGFLGIGIYYVVFNLDITIINLGLAKIAKGLDASLLQMQWAMNIFLLFSAVFILIAGRLADIIGKRRLFIVGMALFFLGSLACGLATNVHFLIISRAVTGLGAGLVTPIATLMTLSMFPEERRLTILGFIIGIIGISQALGPTVGGIILHTLSWHWLFLLNVPLTVISMGLVCWVYPKDKALGTFQALNKTASTILVAGLFLLMLALNQASQWGVGSSQFIVTLVIGLGLLVLFFISNHKSRKPLLPSAVVSNLGFLLVSTYRGLFFYILATMLFILPLYFQNILSLTALQSGFLLLFFTFFYGFLTLFAGRVSKLIGPRHCILIGMFALIMGCLLLSQAPASMRLLLLCPALFFVGLAMALIMPITVNLALGSTPPEHAGSTMGFLLTQLFLFGAIGIAIAGTVFNTINVQQLMHKIVALNLIFSPKQLTQLQHVVSGARPVETINALLGPAGGSKIIPLAQQSFMHGFHTVIWICLSLAVISFVMSVNKAIKYS